MQAAHLLFWCRAIPHIMSSTKSLQRRVTTNPLSRLCSWTWQMHQPASREGCYVYQDYDICIKYWPSREMLIADALSHYAPLTTPAIPLNVSVNHLHITPQKKSDFQDAVHSDPTHRALAEMILIGWPEDICNVPMDLCPYHHACDVLTVEDGIILCGEALVTPLRKGQGTTVYPWRPPSNIQMPIPCLPMCLLAWH